MRFFIAGLFLFGFSSVLTGQTENKGEMQTIFSNPDKKISHGGYAAVSIGYTQIGGEDVMTLGGRAGWLIDHHVTLGLSGTALVSSIYLDQYWPGSDGYYLVGGYGGFFIEPVIAPFFPVHISLPILIGGGGLALNDRTWYDYSWDDDYYDPYDYDAFFVFEPGVEIELNVVKFFRVAFGASYRLTSDLHMPDVPRDMMNGFSGAVTFKLGVF